MKARSHSAEIYNRLKASVRRLCSANGGQDAASVSTRVSQQHLSRYGNPADEFSEQHAPIDVIADLETAIGDPIVTRALAQLSGYFLVRRPECAGGSAFIMRTSGAAMQEVSDMFSKLGEALGDGKITPDEADRIIREADEAMLAIVNLIEAVKAEVRAGE